MENHTCLAYVEDLYVLHGLGLHVDNKIVVVSDYKSVCGNLVHAPQLCIFHTFNEFEELGAQPQP